MARMDDMFRARNKMIRVEHYGEISKMSSRNLDLENKWVKDKLKCNFAMGIDQEGKSLDLYMQ